MKKVLLFPYNLNSCELISYRDMLLEYEIVGVIAPSGWGLTDQDAGYVDGGTDTLVYIKEAIDYNMDFQGVLVTAPYEEYNLDKLIMPKII